MPAHIQLLEVLFPKARLSILSALFSDPKKERFMQELADELGVKASTLQEEFKKLRDVGIIDSRRDRGRVYYRASKSCPIYKELVALFKKTL